MLKFILLLIIILCVINIRSLFETYSNKNNNNVNMVICGCARDNGKYLPDVLKKINEITKLCNKYYIIIYENDSIDNTLELLTEFNKKHKDKCHIISENNIDKIYPKRTHRLGYTRNKILDYIEQNEFNDKYNYYLNMDLDDVNVNLDVNSIKRVLKSRLNWDVVSANQKDYYDYWALRTEKYNNNSWAEGLHPALSNNKHLWGKVDKINKPFKVLSAFGGLAIYKMDKIKNCKYDGIYKNKYSKEEEDCEHVEFHKQIREKNGGDKQYIIPYLLNN